jgi:two-component system response regulator HydG
MPGKILIVEDDSSFGVVLKKWFTRNSFEVQWCTEVEKAMTLLSESVFDAVLSDLRLPDGDGIMLLTWMRERGINIPVIIMTGYGEIQTAVSAIKMGAFDFLEKPINPSLLKQKIDAAFASVSVASNGQKKSVKPASSKSGSMPPSIVKGRSPASERLYEHIQLVASTQMTVMIIGESGTGKEHVARMIHAYSSRNGKPFVPVDCGSLSDELAASELFGHKKGSFTSAIGDKGGLFLEADGGTLFLDEVGNLSYGVQTQLLRALQERKIRAVGESSDRDVDVRIVVATNENLEKAIGLGGFREDLYHRLNEFVIEVPPLRERTDDLELYALHFLQDANKELGKNIKKLSQPALKQLEKYAFPGNLRELRNIVRRAALFASGDEITLENLPTLSNRNKGDDLFGKQLRTTNEEEKQRIIAVLNQTKGNKVKAARLLQIDRKTLYNKMHAYGLEL